MNQLKNIFGLLGLAIFLSQCSACKEPNGPDSNTKSNYIIHWITQYQNQDLIQGQTYRDAFQRRVLFEDLRGYISQVELIDNQDSSIVLKDIALVNWFADPTISIEGRPATIKAIRFSLGVPAQLNTNVDPTTYANSHPLSVAGSAGLFWTWNTGYIFYQLNGKCELTGSENLPMIDPIAYHCGDDTLYRTITLNVPEVTVAAGGAQQFNILFDAQKCFWNDTDTMDFAVDYLTHTTGNLPLAIRAMDLYQSAFSIP